MTTPLKKKKGIKYFFTEYREKKMMKFIIIMSVIAFIIFAVLAGSGIGIYFLVKKLTTKEPYIRKPVTNEYEIYDNIPHRPTAFKHKLRDYSKDQRQYKHMEETDKYFERE